MICPNGRREQRRQTISPSQPAAVVFLPRKLINKVVEKGGDKNHAGKAAFQKEIDLLDKGMGKKGRPNGLPHTGRDAQQSIEALDLFLPAKDDPRPQHQIGQCAEGKNEWEKPFHHASSRSALNRVLRDAPKS